MKALALTNLYISRTIALLAVVCSLSVFLYGFFLLEAVAHTASRSSAEHSIAQLQSKLGVLEGQYLSQSRTLTPELATSLGFVPPASVESIYAQGPSLLTVRDVR